MGGKYVTLDGEFIQVGDSRATSGHTCSNTKPEESNCIPGADPQIGDVMKDGTVFAGISPGTGRPMYALPADAPLTITWQQAMDYAADFKGHGHPKGTFRVPTSGELKVLFENRAKIGGFNDTGSYPSGWHWSATEYPGYPGYAWVERFSDGRQNWLWKGDDASVRLVRN